MARKKITISEKSESRRSSDPKAVPAYQRASTGSCHHVCKYGGKHTFGEEEEAAAAAPRPTRQSPRKPSLPAAKEQPEAKAQKRALIKIRSLSRRTAGDIGKSENIKNVTADTHDAALSTLSASLARKQSDDKSEVKAQKRALIKIRSLSRRRAGDVGNSGHIKKATAEDDKTKPVEAAPSSPAKSVKEAEGRTKQAIEAAKKQNDGRSQELPNKSLIRSARSTGTPPRKPARSNIGRRGEGSNRVTGLRPPRPEDATQTDQEMVQEEKALPPLERESGGRQRAKGGKAAVAPCKGENPVRLRSRRAAVAGEESSSGGGALLRARSLPRRGGGPGAGAVGAPVVVLRHQRTLEKKKSRRLYNSLIEETASALVKSRKSRVKALVGAFETLISKISK